MVFIKSSESAEIPEHETCADMTRGRDMNREVEAFRSQDLESRGSSRPDAGATGMMPRSGGPLGKAMSPREAYINIA